QEWGIDREQAEKLIQEEHLPVPLKSSCYFCPAMKLHEISQLKVHHPELAERAIALEDAALAGKHGPVARALKGKKTSTIGLGRRFAWKQFLADEARALAGEAVERTKGLPKKFNWQAFLAERSQGLEENAARRAAILAALSEREGLAKAIFY